MSNVHTALAALCLGVVLCASAAQAQPAKKLATGSTFFAGEIVSPVSNKCLDIKDESKEDGAVVQQWSCAKLPHQLWTVTDLGRGEFSIISQSSKKSLDVSGASADDGATIVQMPFRDVDNQRWRLEITPSGSYKIINTRTRKCLDLQEGKRDDGIKIQQWSCSGEPNQMWLLRK